MNSFTRLACLSFTIALSSVCASSPGHGQSGAGFYQGKTLRIIVGYAPGGGFDLYARMLADHISRHIPGAPKTLVQNMPGADSAKAVAHVYSVAPQDGTVLVIPNHSLPMSAYLWPDQRVGFDPGKFNWIGRLDYIDIVGVAWHTSGIQSIEDLKKNSLIYGGTTANSNAVMTPRALNRLVGTKFHIVQGYTGSSDLYLAMEKGEVRGMGNAIWSQLQRSHPDWLAQKKVIPLYQDNYERIALLPDVPTAAEFATNDQDREILRLLGSGAIIGRSFMTGPHVPQERVTDLRRAFTTMTEDAAFRADAERRALPINPLSGERLQAIIAGFAAYPETLLERARQVVAE